MFVILAVKWKSIEAVYTYVVAYFERSNRNDNFRVNWDHQTPGKKNIASIWLINIIRTNQSSIISNFTILICMYVKVWQVDQYQCSKAHKPHKATFFSLFGENWALVLLHYVNKVLSLYNSLVSVKIVSWMPLYTQNYINFTIFCKLHS